MKLDWRHVLCGFLLGCMLGGLAGARFQRAASHRFWQRGPDPERITRKFTQKLDLDGMQQQAVRAIVQAHHAKIMALRGESDGKFGALRTAMHDEIRKTLRPEQQQKLDAMAVRWETRHKSRQEKP